MHDEKKKAFWERECLCLVRERTKLQRSEDELSMAKRGLTLENERASAENEYRQLINLPGETVFLPIDERVTCCSILRGLETRRISPSMVKSKDLFLSELAVDIVFVIVEKEQTTIERNDKLFELLLD